MPANKMPNALTWIPLEEAEVDGMTTRQAEAYGRACYLAAIEAAKACVPDEIHERGPAEKHWNACRDTTLTNLTALEQEAKK